MYARSLNPLKCAYFDRLQAAVILIKGLLSKYEKLTILKYLAFNKRTRCPGLPQYCLNCMKFGKLTLRKIVKIVATGIYYTVSLKKKTLKLLPASSSYVNHMLF